MAKSFTFTVELGKWWKNSEIVSRLDLSEKQVIQIEKSFLEHRPELARLNDALKQQETELQKLMSDDPRNAVGIQRARMLNDQLKQQEAELQKLMSDDRKSEANKKEIASIRSAIVFFNNELKRQETELKKLMGGDGKSETADQRTADAIRRVATTRANLEIENSSMLADIRKALSWEQWETLEKIRNVEIAIVGDTVQPRPINQPNPAYTDQARNAKISGVIVVKVLIHKDGSVSPLKIVQGLGYGLDEATIETIAKKWKFHPGVKNGKPVDAEATVEISFQQF
jgi:TonB family protein